MVGCSSRLLEVVLPSAAELALAMLSMLGSAPQPRLAATAAAACTPERSMLSSSFDSSASDPCCCTAGGCMLLSALLLPILAVALAVAPANALLLPADAQPVPEPRSRPLLALLRPLRSGVCIAAAAAVEPTAASASLPGAFPLPDAPLGRGSSELPVAAVLNGLAAAAAKGFEPLPLPFRLPERPAPLLLPLLLGRLPLLPPPPGVAAASTPPGAGCCCSPLSGEGGPFAAAAMAALSLHCRCCSPAAGVGARSIITTVMLSLLPLSTAAFVSTVAATRAAALRDAPFSRARLMERSARSVAS